MSMLRKTIAVVGAAETTKLGKIPDESVLGLHADAALNALNDAGLTVQDIDGVATAGISPVDLAYYLGITPTFADGTMVGGCSFMLLLRHAAAAINEGLCNTVLITHAESGRSRIDTGVFPRTPSSLVGQFQQPYGVYVASTVFTLPALRYMKTYGATEEDLARVAVVQRDWAGRNPRASFREPITIEDVLSSPIVAWPFRKLMCCLVTDGGGALIITNGERARDLPQKPVYVIGTGEATESPLVDQMEDLTSSKAFRISGCKAFQTAGIRHDEVDHLMIYDAFAHIPLYGLEDLGFVGRGEAKDFIREGHTGPGGKLPMNTNGGGLSYMHSGMYGMYALQESVRQMRGVAPAQVDGAKISVCHGVGGWFSAAGTIVFSNELPG